jgi:hypothetical protein
VQDDPVVLAQVIRYPLDRELGHHCASELSEDIGEILGDQEPLSDREGLPTSLRDVSQAVSHGAAALTVVLVGLICDRPQPYRETRHRAVNA